MEGIGNVEEGWKEIFKGGRIVILDGRKEILWRGLEGRMEEGGLYEGDWRKQDF